VTQEKKKGRGWVGIVLGGYRCGLQEEKGTKRGGSKEGRPPNQYGRRIKGPKEGKGVGGVSSCIEHAGGGGGEGGKAMPPLVRKGVKKGKEARRLLSVRWTKTWKGRKKEPAAVVSDSVSRSGTKKKEKKERSKVPLISATGREKKGKGRASSRVMVVERRRRKN